MTNISEKTTGSCKDREYIVTEVCPHCEAEVEMRWNVAADGYKAFCPHCGNRLIHSWPAIKQELLQKVQNVAERKSSLDNFEL